MILDRLFWTGYVAYHALGQGRYPFKPMAAILRDQSRRVRAMVDYAYRHVPYYRETMDRLGLTPVEIRSADDLARLPLIEMEHIQRDPEYYISRELPQDRYIEVSSSGSTGLPHSIWYDQGSLFLMGAYSGRERRVISKHLGRHWGGKGMAILPVPSTGRKVIQFHHDRTLFPQSLRLWRQMLSMADPIERIVHQMNQFQPDVLATYGSYLDMLFAWLKATGTPFHRPRLIIFSADGVTDATRRLLAEEYGIPLLSLYQSVEAWETGFECECHKGHHVNMDLYALRITDGAGRTLPVGESGQVVVSNLLNRGMMLLNYRLGDLAALLPDACPCGRSLPLLSWVSGRSQDVLELPSGRALHPAALVGIFRGMDDVRQYQIVQRTLDQFEVRLVVGDSSHREDLRGRLAPRFHKELGDGVRVDFQFVDAIAALPGGKRPVVLSLCKQARAQA
jgi:phenylacetate-CoA ligase